MYNINYSWCILAVFKDVITPPLSLTQTDKEKSGKGTDPIQNMKPLCKFYQKGKCRHNEKHTF